jgi:hypothetical protein
VPVADRDEGLNAADSVGAGEGVEGPARVSCAYFPRKSFVRREVSRSTADTASRLTYPGSEMRRPGLGDEAAASGAQCAPDWSHSRQPASLRRTPARPARRPGQPWDSRCRRTRPPHCARRPRPRRPRSQWSGPRGADPRYVIAFSIASRGTQHTIDQARQRGSPVRVVAPRSSTTLGPSAIRGADLAALDGAQTACH